MDKPRGVETLLPTPTDSWCPNCCMTCSPARAAAAACIQHSGATPCSFSCCSSHGAAAPAAVVLLLLLLLQLLRRSRSCALLLQLPRCGCSNCFHDAAPAHCCCCSRNCSRRIAAIAPAAMLQLPRHCCCTQAAAVVLPLLGLCKLLGHCVERRAILEPVDLVLVEGVVDRDGVG